jgi:hypothetical protein
VTAIATSSTAGAAAQSSYSIKGHFSIEMGEGELKTEAQKEADSVWKKHLEELKGMKKDKLRDSWLQKKKRAMDSWV